MIFRINDSIRNSLKIKLEKLKSATKSIDTSAILMKNVQGDEGNTRSPTFERTFKIDNHMTSLFSYTNVVQVSFFDLYDDVIKSKF